MFCIYIFASANFKHLNNQPCMTFNFVLIKWLKNTKQSDEKKKNIHIFMIHRDIVSNFAKFNNSTKQV